MAYKWCVVSQCSNTSINKPHKMFVSVPKNAKRRKMWLQLSGRDPKSISKHSNVFMCEDHFDMNKDTINYMKFKMGFSQKILLTNEAMPTKFHCQENSKRRLHDAGSFQEGYLKRQRINVVTECLESQNTSEILPKDDEEIIEWKVLMIPENGIEVNVKVEIEENAIKLEENYYQNSVNLENEIDSVPLECSRKCLETKDDVDFKIEVEKVKIEALTNQEEEKSIEEQFVEATDNDMKRIMSNYNESESVPIEYSQIDCRMEDEVDFKVEIEENIKIEINNEEEASEEFVEPEENFETAVIQRVKQTEEKLKGVATDYRTQMSKLAECQYSTNFPYSLKRKRRNEKVSILNHVKISQVDVKKFKCNICLYSTNFKQVLKRHIAAIHFNERKFECHLCEYKASRKSTLDYHLNAIHLTERRFKCHLCGYKTNRKSTLDYHLNAIHSTECRFKCHLSEYQANRKSDSDIHLSSVHFMQRHFKCNLCEYKTNRKWYIDQHDSSAHLKEHKFQCDLYEYKTNRKFDLEKHFSCVHLIQRTFECHLCEYKANGKMDRDKHINSVHFKERKFECHLCQYKANLKSSFKKHLNSVH